jgi:hypothetical protein
LKRQHIERIDQLELIQREMWKLYDMEKEPRHKAVKLQKIANVQPYMYAYYEATEMVMKARCHRHWKEKLNI